MTIIITIIGLSMVSLVAYAVFILPYRTDWEAVSRSLDIYEEPQSFTEVGLEAEWGTPQTPNVATAVDTPSLQNFFRPKEGNAVMQAVVLPSLRRVRKGTVLGVIPPSNKSISGIRRMSRSELAHLVRENLCIPECQVFVQHENIWQCQCGAVTKHANMSSGIASQLSV